MNKIYLFLTIFFSGDLPAAMHTSSAIRTQFYSFLCSSVAVIVYYITVSNH